MSARSVGATLDGRSPMRSARRTVRPTAISTARSFAVSPVELPTSNTESPAVISATAANAMAR